MFAGPRLKRVHNDSIVLIGDASHPLSGAFGDGAGFALEDAYVVAQSLLWAHQRKRSLPDALDLFDDVRSPHYKRLYAVLDETAAASQWLDDPDTSLSFDEEVAALVASKWQLKNNWMHHYDVCESRLETELLC